MLHLDDLERLDLLAAHARRARTAPADTFTGRAQRLLAMVHFSLWGWAEPLDQPRRPARAAVGHPARRDELLQVPSVLRDRIRRVTGQRRPDGELPLHVHARYSLAELLRGLRHAEPVDVAGRRREVDP